MTGRISSISSLDKRLAELELIETEQMAGLQASGRSIGDSFTATNMIKMALKGVCSKPEVTGTELAVFAGTFIAENIIGKEKFSKIRNITAPFVRIVLDRLTSEKTKVAVS